MKYAVFIISHKRSDRVETFDTLLKAGYKGNLYIVVDKIEEEDYKRFSPNVLVYDKQRIKQYVDTITNDKKNSSPVYARFAVEVFARDFDAYIIMDDDITNIRYRWIENNHIRSMTIKHGIKDVFDYFIEYMLKSNIAALSFVYNMFFVGGYKGLDKRVTDSRHTYQIHFRNMRFPVEWKSLSNNDTITELLTMKLGYLWWSLPFVDYDAVPMNTKSGGMKDVYDSVSDFDKVFLAVIACPSCCKIGYSSSTRGSMRIIEDKDTSYPMIVSSRFKKC